MINPKELQKLGEQISQDFLSRDIPLTQGLEKVAHENGLNKNQIDRVAETANVKTHLEFLKTAKNEAYINFDLAEPTQVKAPAQVKEASLLDDYYSAPIKHNEDFLKEASFYEIKEEKKTPGPDELYKEARLRREKVERISEEVADASARMENTFEPLYSLVKQAALSGVPIDHLQSAVNKGAEPLGEYFIQKLAARLEKDNIDFNADDLTKHASRKINRENPIFKKAQEVNNLTLEALEKSAELKEAFDALGDHLIEKQAKEIGLLPWLARGVVETGKWIGRNPVPASLVGAGTLGTVYGANRYKKNNTKLENIKIQGRTRSRAY